MALGSVIGGKMMSIGRRLSMIISILISIAAVSVTLIKEFKVIMIGRFFYGLTSGMMSAIIARYVEETVPFTLYENIIPSLTLS